MEIDDSKTERVPNLKPARRPHHPRCIESEGKPARYRTLKPAIKQQRPLLVKAVFKHRIKHSTSQPKRSCRIHLCRLLNCNLRTHQYKSILHSNVNKSASPDDLALPPSSSNGDRPPSSRSPDPHNSVQLLRGGVDGLPALPLDDQHRDVYVELFHHFFNEQYDRIVRIVTPHSIAPFQKQTFAYEKNQTFIRALSAPIFCLHVCASSHHQIVFRGDSMSPSNITTLIRFTLTTLLRDLLNNVELSSTNSNNISLVILTLVMFETSMNDYSALAFHRKAMCYLARKQGGVHNMERWIPYILLLDRMISIFTALPPVLCKYPDRALRRPARNAQVYGSFFDHRGQNCLIDDQAIFDFCFDTCRAIELMEHEGPIFDPVQEPKAEYRDLHYLYYLKENLAGQFAHLNARLAQEGAAGARQLHRCALLATKIVDCSILHNNYVVSIPIYCANTARNIIDQCFKLPSFLGSSSVLTWILFVMASMQLHWEGHDWALERLQMLLELKYGSFRTSEWPKNWKTHEHDNVRSFVWSDVRFDSSFYKCCNELEMTQSATISEIDELLDEASLVASLDDVFESRLIDATFHG